MTNRAAYFREYRRAHAARYNAQAKDRNARKMQRYWLYWLLDTIEWPAEPEYIVPTPAIVRRPILRLSRP